MLVCIAPYHPISLLATEARGMVYLQLRQDAMRVAQLERFSYTLVNLVQ